MTRLTLALGSACALLACSTPPPPAQTTPPDATVAFVADAPATYVAKVKQLLVGQPPTDGEIAMVVADPHALTGLIASWMAQPEYQEKMRVFFALAFQQTQITEADFLDLVPPIGLGRGAGVPALVQNVTESFARTVLALNAQGRPLTEAFQTRQLMMTPALMELYAFLDARTVADDGTEGDTFAAANPGLKITVEAAGGPIPLADSLDPASPNYLTFYNPDLPTNQYGDTACNGIDPVVAQATALNLHYTLYGAVPAHRSPAHTNCPQRADSLKAVQLAPSDFTSWRMVTIRAPRLRGEKPTSFLDLPALRQSTELVLITPRVGFFSTPAFQANWPTNASNTMRVTLNQSLIVATGAAVDGSDETIAPTTPGLDASHAAPGSSCYGCHQLLDPTRSILSSTYSWFYSRQADPTLIAQPGLFAFQGVVAPMHAIDDFARLLATHPLVAQGWAQKLCYYANSAPCDPRDPEFQRIVASFAQGYRWDDLVAQLMASPIITNAALTKTWETNGEVIAVARRDHLCAALDARLGFVDVCGRDVALGEKANPLTKLIQQIVSGLPSDGYGRGSIIPVLPNQPTMFYRAGLETICESVAQLVIDPLPAVAVPGSKTWAGAQPTPAIADFVGTVMGLPPGDPRAAPAQAILTDHFTAAAATPGVTPTDALRSTFTAACLSPSFVGIGL